MLRNESLLARSLRLWKVTSRRAKTNFWEGNGVDNAGKKHSKLKNKNPLIRHTKPLKLPKSSITSAKQLRPGSGKEDNKELFIPLSIDPEVDKETENIGEQLVGALATGKNHVHYVIRSLQC